MEALIVVGLILCFAVAPAMVAAARNCRDSWCGGTAAIGIIGVCVFWPLGVISWMMALLGQSMPEKA